MSLEKEHPLRSQKDLGSNPTVSYANVGEFFNFCQLQFHCLQNGKNTSLPSLDRCEDNVGKLFLVGKVLTPRGVLNKQLLTFRIEFEIAL